MKRANVWVAGLVISCSAFCTYLYFFWYPSYLREGRGVDPDTASLLAGMVLAGGALGGTTGGYLSDWLVRRTGSRRWARRIVGVLGMGLAGLLLWCSIQAASPGGAAGCAAAAAFCANVHLAAWWGVVTDISGKHVGALFGLMNMMGVPGATASQIYLGRYVDWRKAAGFTDRDAWDPGLYAHVTILLVGAVAWLFLDATKPLVDELPQKAPQDVCGHD